MKSVILQSKLFLILILFISSYSFISAQKTSNKDSKNSVLKINSTQALNDEIQFKNESGNAIITITDEGNNKGSITIPDSTGPPSNTDNKLYNVNGTLHFNNATLGSGGGADSINHLLDAKYDGSSLFLGAGSGSDDDGTDNKNTGVGYQALSSNTSGSENTANGYQALFTNTTGVRNTANGYQALLLNTTGSENIANGRSALYSNTTGRENTANGYQVLYLNTTGYSNTANGYRALWSNTTGYSSTANGFQALWGNTTGVRNIGIGSNANLWNREGSQNTIIGYEAGKGEFLHNKSGNVFLGYKSGFNEIGDDKLYIENSDIATPLIWGDFSTDSVIINGGLKVTSKTTTPLLQVTSGATNGFVLTSDASGNATWQTASSGGATEINDLADAKYDGTSLFLGEGSGADDDGTDNYNTGVGNKTLFFNTTGKNNTANGYQALYYNTSGNSNTANGYQGLTYNTTGGGNTANGFRALYTNTTGYANTANGLQALNSNTTGHSNTGIGRNVNYYNQEGSENTIIGYEAGKGTSLHNKSGNVFLGYKAGFGETGDDKLYIENSDIATPLIWGDFSTDSVIINGGLKITSKTTTPLLQVTSGATNGFVLTSDASGNATWQSHSGDNDWSVHNGQATTILSNQSHSLGIGMPLNSSLEATLHLIGNDGVLFQGTHAGGATSILGQGSRFHWYPKKSALRAGYVNADQWHHGNMGDYSVAMGYNTTASGNHSTAIGFQTTASLNVSTAMGGNTTANGSYSTAMGFGTISSGDISTAMGQETIASGNYSTSMGSETTASGNYSTAMGQNTIAGGWAATALGNATTSSGNYSSALGVSTRADAFFSTAIGAFNIGGGTNNLRVNTEPVFEVGIGSSPTTRENAMTILKNGKVGIGPSSPSDRVEITSSTGEHALRVRVGSGTKLRILSNGGTTIGTNNTTSTPANGLYVHGDILYNGAHTSTSDIRFKINIKPVQDALGKINNIRGVYYDWKKAEFPERDFNGERQIGVIAQEVEQEFPELVQTNLDGYKSVDYTKLAPILIEAVKELTKKNLELSNRIENLENITANRTITTR